MLGLSLSAPMVRAFASDMGRKTCTRRIMNPQPTDCDLRMGPDASIFKSCRYRPGETVFIAEAWRTLDFLDIYKPSDLTDAPIKFEADGQILRWRRSDLAPRESGWGRYRHARFLPERFARYHAIIGKVWAERLQEITEQEAVDEGYYQAVAEGTKGELEPVEWYKTVWKSIHGPGSWDDNPMVWRIGLGRKNE